MRDNKGVLLFKSLLTFVLLYGCCLNSKADTIDYWHVKYNNKLIRKYTANNSNREIIINLLRAKVTDRITVNYGRDTHDDCINELILEDDKKNSIALPKEKDTSIRFLSLWEILKNREENIATSIIAKKGIQKSYCPL